MGQEASRAVAAGSAQEGQEASRAVAAEAARESREASQRQQTCRMTWSKRQPPARPEGQTPENADEGGRILAVFNEAAEESTPADQ